MATKSDWRLIAVSKASNLLPRRSFTLKSGENRVGRLSESEIRIPSKLCSRKHCSIFVNGYNVKLVDHSQNGTFVNDTRLMNPIPVQLKFNDTISFGLKRNVEQNKQQQSFAYSLIRDSGEAIEIADSDDEEVTDSKSENEPFADNSIPPVICENSFKDDEVLLQVSTEPSTSKEKEKLNGFLSESTPIKRLTFAEIEAARRQKERDEKFNKIVLGTATPNDAQMDLFRTKVKVKVSKLSRGELLIADMLITDSN